MLAFFQFILGLIVFVQRLLKGRLRFSGSFAQTMFVVIAWWD